MTWRDRLGRNDERVAVAARARGLLGAAPAPVPLPPAPPGPVPPVLTPPVSVPPGSGAPVVAATTTAVRRASWASEAVPPPRFGGWVPPPLPAYGSPDVPPGITDDVRPGRADVDGAVDGGVDDAVGLDDVAFGPGRFSFADRRTERPGRWRARLDQVRLDPGRRGMAAIAAVVVVVAAVAGGWLLSTRPGSAAVTGAAPVAGLSTAGSTSAAGSGAASGAASGAGAPAGSVSAGSLSSAGSVPGRQVVVDVVGLVARPGVYRLPAGARVQDLLTAAGGPLPGADLTMVNQARILVDGEQLAVGVTGAPTVPGAAGGPATPGGGVVDLNTADLTALEALPGVGPVLGQHIIDWRTEHGRFDSVDQLEQVSGIGPSRFADLKDLVSV